MFDQFQDYLVRTFGEFGAEVFNDALIYYLNNNTDWPCEEDKLFLLSYLYFNSDATQWLKPDYNPLHHFEIKINK